MADSPMKIVGIGLNKTGTKTLGSALREWQLKHVSFSRKGCNLWRDNDLTALMSMVADYESFEDWPWPLVFREIDSHFPGSKFILTRRINPDVWFESLCKHADRTGPTEIRKNIYGFEMPHQYKREHVQYYEEHLQSVRQHFKDRPEALLEVCWEEGSGWAELADFLGRPIPDVAFPHKNKAPA